MEDGPGDETPYSGKPMRLLEVTAVAAVAAAFGGGLAAMRLGARTAYDIFGGVVLGLIPGVIAGIVAAPIARYGIGEQRWKILGATWITSLLAGSIGTYLIVSAIMRHALPL